MKTTYVNFFISFQLTIHVAPSKSCGYHINLVSLMWILINQRYYVKKCVLKCILLTYLI